MSQEHCKYCKTEITGNYCSNCGNKMVTARISLGSILHEVIHFFTHLDHGFPLTLKRLFVAPGKMQRDYVDGLRAKYQKPFSMFFLSATVAALLLYYINTAVVQYFQGGEEREVEFFHKYWALLQVCMLPVYAFITYLFFMKSKLNYGEILVLQLYTFAALFLLITFIHLLKFPFPHLQTRYIELPAVVIYTLVTNLNFFRGMNKKWIVMLSIFAIGLSFFLANTVQDYLVSIF